MLTFKAVYRFEVVTTFSFVNIEGFGKEKKQPLLSQLHFILLSVFHLETSFFFFLVWGIRIVLASIVVCVSNTSPSGVCVRRITCTKICLGNLGKTLRNKNDVKWAPQDGSVV